jgi:hypothetical protein
MSFRKSTTTSSNPSPQTLDLSLEPPSLDAFNLPSSSSLLQLMSNSALHHNHDTSQPPPPPNLSSSFKHLRAPSFLTTALKKKATQFTTKVEKATDEDHPPDLPQFQIVEQVAQAIADQAPLKKLEDTFCCLCCCAHPEEYFSKNYRIKEENFSKFASVLLDYEELYGETHYSTGKKDLVCDQVFDGLMGMYKYKERRMLLPEQKEEKEEEERRSLDRDRPSLDKPRKSDKEVSMKDLRKSVEISKESLEALRKSLDGKEEMVSMDEMESRILEVIEETTKGIQKKLKDSFSKPSILDIAKDIFKVMVATLLTLSLIFVGAVPICYIERAHEIKTNGKATKWNYGNAVYYIIVTLTTIGLGDFTPSTDGGRIYMMFFIIVTLGMVGLCLAVAGEALLRSLKTLLFLIVLYTKRIVHIIIQLCCTRTRDYDEEDLFDPSILFSDDLTKFEKRIYKFVNGGITQIILTACFLVLYCLFSALIFRRLEGWTYFRALWFCFITLATIGYGDTAPTTSGSKIFFCFYALLGSGTIALLLGFVGQAVSDRVSQSIQAMKKKAIEEARASERNAASRKLDLIMQDVRAREKAVKAQIQSFKQTQKAKAKRSASKFISRRNSLHQAAKEKSKDIQKKVSSSIKHMQDRKEEQKNVLFTLGIDDVLNHDD